MTTLTAESRSRLPAGDTTVVTRIPNHNTDTRVAEILGLLESPAIPADGNTGILMANLERERRRLHHALTMLRAARQKLHEQYLANKDEQQRVIGGLQREWTARRRQMETQIATAAMQKAREELAEERAHLEAEFQQRDLEWHRERDTRDQEWNDFVAIQERERNADQNRINSVNLRHRNETESLRKQLDDERDRYAQALEEHQAELQNQQDVSQKQLNELRAQLVQAELSLVKDRAEWAEERRRWNDERAKAESIIKDLLAELETRTTKPAVKQAA